LVKIPAMKKEYFITLEGGEGSGKTTQSELLAQALKSQGYGVLLTREPGGTPVGDQIRQVVLASHNVDMHNLTELLLYEASRYQHVKEVIEPALAEGKVVICDRYADASMAYQGYGRGIPLEVVAV